MPEYPDIIVYIERLTDFVAGRRLLRIRLKSPFLVRSVEPPVEAVHNTTVRGFARMGKRIVFQLSNDAGDELFIVLHLMIAGRLRWRKAGAALSGKQNLAAFDFDHGSLMLTEASSKKRASLYVVGGRSDLAQFDRGGLEPMEATLDEFRAALTQESHTLKRTLTDPRLFSGIGNAYSDEILHRARLSPVRLNGKLHDDEIERLYHASRDTLREWTERLRRDVGSGFPDKVTAFHDDMAVHGRYNKPCPDCGEPVQRIRYANKETNYCAKCQNAGKLLSDRAISRLLKKDWPKTLEQLEELKNYLARK